MVVLTEALVEWLRNQSRTVRPPSCFSVVRWECTVEITNLLTSVGLRSAD